MAEETTPNNQDLTPTEAEETAESAIAPAGVISTWLSNNDFEHQSLEPDHLDVEMIRVEADLLLPLSTALYAYGFNYLQCQGAYDEGPGKSLVSFYHLVKLTENGGQPEEVRVKVFLPREKPILPSVYWIWKAADWQERECYDMFGIIYEGHPNLKRILMPEDWVGWPLRKDYISPDFYELQDAY